MRSWELYLVTKDGRAHVLGRYATHREADVILARLEELLDKIVTGGAMVKQACSNYLTRWIEQATRTETSPGLRIRVGDIRNVGTHQIDSDPAS